MAELKGGMLLRFPVDGEARWRLYTGWGSETSRISTCDPTLHNWIRLKYADWRFRRGKPIVVRVPLDGERYHDGLTIGRLP